MDTPNLRFDFTDPGKTQDPVDPKDNQDPNDPANPNDPNDPNDPADPSDPNDPADPNDPNDPADPDDPNDPQDPNDPDDPQDPDGGNLYTELNTHLGIEVEGEFEDSPEGLTQYIKSVSNTMAATALESVFEALPDVKEFLEYRQKGGEPSKFFQAVHPETDYSKIDITSEDVGTQREIVRALLRHQKYDEAYINETLADYAEANILEKQAKHAKSTLTAIQKDAADAEKKRVSDAETLRIKEAQDNWKKVTETVGTGNLGTIIIPESEKNGFLDWMSKPIDEKGNTRRDIEKGEMPIETQLMLEYMIYKKADVSKLVINKANTKNARSISDRIRQKNVGNKMNTNNQRQRTAPVKLPSLDAFFGRA